MALKNGNSCAQENPHPHKDRILAKLEYLSPLATDSAYIIPQGPTESVKTYRKRIHNNFLTLLQAETPPTRMCIDRLWPDTNWQVVWTNLWATPASESTKETCYRVIRDIVPTWELLRNISIAPTDACTICNMPETRRHRITECGNGRFHWEWTRRRLALMLRTEPRWVPEE
jgi:hypothetical protein